MRTVMRYVAVLSLICCALTVLSCSEERSDSKMDGDQVVVEIRGAYKPSKPEDPRTEQLIELMREDDRLKVMQWGGIRLPGGAGRSDLMMSIAGQMAPDIYYSWFHIIRNDISNGFLHPLNSTEPGHIDWIGTDDNGNGQIDLDEATWEGWKDIPELWRRVATMDGKVYGIPYAGIQYVGLIYRKDLVEKAGYDPDNLPTTWDEYWRFCQRLTFPAKEVAGAKYQRGQRAYCVNTAPFFWLPWLQAAGGSPVIQIKTSPETGREYTFPMDATDFRVTENGETVDLTSAPTEWKAHFDSPAGRAAIGFYYKLRWAPWLRDPETRRPVDLFVPDPEHPDWKFAELPVARLLLDGEIDQAVLLLEEGRVAGAFAPAPDGKFASIAMHRPTDPDASVVETDEKRFVDEVPVGPAQRKLLVRGEEVIEGVIRPDISPQDEGQAQLFAKGEIVVMQWYIDELERYGQTAGLPSDLIGMFPFPAMNKRLDDEGQRKYRPVFQGHKHYYVMTEGVGRRPKKEQQKVWQCLKAMTSQEVYDREVRKRVIQGNAMLCKPDDLRRLGLEEYLDEMPEQIKENYAMVERGEIKIGTEPFSGFWQAASDILAQGVIQPVLADKGREVDFEAAIQTATFEANRGVMFEVDEEVIDRHRPLGRVLFGIGAVVFVVMAFLIVRSRYQPKAGSSGGVSSGRWIAWAMLAPAILTILLWSYYPLLRGMVMAFQDYRIVGESEWVGLNNFIVAAIDKNTWMSVLRTLQFVGLTICIGFVAPIVLAFLVTEAPRWKIFFRTLFFLPQMTSAIIVALLWKLMYDPTEFGFLNQVLGFIGIEKQNWLFDEDLAMLCCVLPAVWAGAGIQSLIYVAALRSLPDDYYEAAALDGAGIFRRVIHVSIPQLLPLIVINFVGTFIAAFQNMNYIFLLTFGGPNRATEVLGMTIWKLAYNDLRFSMATTLAWFLGVALIGFTYFQIRFLRRVEFRRAEQN